MEETVDLDGKKYTGIRFELGNVPLLILKVKSGYVACSYIDKATAEKLGDIACFVSGVKSYDDMYKAKVKCATQWAEDLGIREGMSVKKALELIDAYQEKP
ncbi:hypothetical protein COV61_03560 [Candidatus Micrarchaeota archaeon CG11_big_fil_rev_8_21_14_0_20_47_5]|nr:MAG: hypothetical protein AUJ17_05655 [Candidatus Micrarchaeota archaeon CG1_02_47_40]PIN83287.1 MAG: hypothetical protein COV61_03560 [Candidatus Micrarchaeota archaeon CG11_big_fil_rev_8_21_14_0_20_47_5]